MKTSVMFQITPVWYEDHVPHVIVHFAGNKLFDGLLMDDFRYYFEMDLEPGSYDIDIQFTNKTDQDTDIDKNLDKAVIVEKIWVNKVKCDECLYEAIYYPENREPIKGHNYLSWNGTWKLTVSVPAFEWLHKLKNLGWVFR